VSRGTKGRAVDGSVGGGEKRSGGAAGVLGGSDDWISATSGCDS